MQRMMDIAHADCHIREIVKAAKVKGNWTGKMTILRPGNGKEYVWQQRLNPREIASLAQHFGGHFSEKNLTFEGSVLDVWYDGDSWKSRAWDTRQ